ncbi:MAG: CapA family protein [bacterium]|nr:CapA family protein [bacterium]
MKKAKPILIMAAVAALLSAAVYFFVFNLLALADQSKLPQSFRVKNTADAKVKNELSFSFAGDVMLGRNVGHYFQKNNFKDLFANFDAGAFQGKDIFWFNLEGPISNLEIKQNPKDKSLVFNFSRQAIEALKYLKITTAGLANNHTANQGAAGLEKTKNILKQAGIDANGDPNKIDGSGVTHYSQGDLVVSLIAVNALYDAKGAEQIIKQEKSQHNFVIVLPHWGNEYQTTHSAGQEKLARSWIGAGADLIIGGHPHVVQDAQVINGKLVFYSLGNFIFDQMFSAETQQGLILSGIISAGKLKITLTPIISKNMKPEIMRGADRLKIIDRICGSLGDYCIDDKIEISLK